jgi:uncharacterized OB-fold protein
MSALPAPVPAINPETRPFWDATTEGVLRLARCTGCGHVIWYPRVICPDCHGVDVEWITASGRGRVHTFTVVRRARGAYAEAAPYVVAYVELAEGPRIVTNIVDTDPATVHIGQPVVATFDDTGAGAALVRFRPEPDEGGSHGR